MLFIKLQDRTCENIKTLHKSAGKSKSVNWHTSMTWNYSHDILFSDQVLLKWHHIIFPTTAFRIPNTILYLILGLQYNFPDIDFQVSYFPS